MGQRIKCFLIEKTEKWFTQPCERSDHSACESGENHWSSKAPVYRRPDTGEEFTLRKAPVGAMWFADWYGDLIKGIDGRTLVVCIPGGTETHHWIIDARASNCTKPTDDKHKCWVRHGDAPEITVDKNGDTCSAGAGSIAVTGYHGFLRNGYLEQC